MGRCDAPTVQRSIHARERLYVRVPVSGVRACALCGACVAARARLLQRVFRSMLYFVRACHVCTCTTRAAVHVSARALGRGTGPGCGRRECDSVDRTNSVGRTVNWSLASR